MTEFRVHPLIEQLIAATEGDESVVELRGFIGPAREGDGEDTVPLYTSLDLRERLLVPKEAILQVVEPEGENRNEEPTRVFVKRSTELRLISVTPIRAEEASRTLWYYGRPAYGHEPGLEPHFSEGGVRTCAQRLRDCIEEARGDPLEMSSCFRRYVRCREWGLWPP